MELRFSADVNPADRESLTALYNDPARPELFEKSFSKRLAYDGDRLVGAVRVISEGVETALLTDLRTVWEEDETAGKGLETALALIREIEKDLNNRRVMACGRRRDLETFEAAGYARCKNAWVFFREGMDESDVLPPGYRFENEFVEDEDAGNRGPARTAAPNARSAAERPEISYRDGLGEASFADVNDVLTAAFWGRPHDAARTEKAFTNSRYSVSAYDGEKLIGVARAVADGGRYATILNVAVVPGYQGLSVGKNLMKKLFGIISEDVIVLNTHPGAVGFYNRLPELRRTKYIFEKFIADLAAERKSDKNPAFRLNMYAPAGYRFPDEY